jgi:hypothetical protein
MSLNRRLGALATTAPGCLTARQAQDAQVARTEEE